MKRRLTTFGIIMILISTVLSGCTDNTSSNEVSYDEIRDHIGKYEGTEITVKGYVSNVYPSSEGQNGWAFFHESNPIENPQAGLSYIYLFLPENITLNLGWYKVTGIIEGSQSIYPIFARINVTSVQIL